MADPRLEVEINAAKQQLERLRNELAVTDAKSTRIYATQRKVNAELREIKAKLQDPSISDEEKDRLADQGTELEQQYNSLEQQGLQTTQSINEINSLIRTAQGELDQLQTQASAGLAQGPQTDSAGTTVDQAQTARTEGANTQLPESVDDRARTQPTTAIPPGQTGLPDQGLDANTRSGQSTQATPPSTAQTPLSPGVNPQVSQDPNAAGSLPGPGPVGASRPGVTTGNDDAARLADATTPGGSITADSASTPAQRIANKTAVQIQPAANVLDSFSSYSYSISLYIMSPQAYTEMIRSGKRVLTGTNLLLQSGGASRADRSQFFPLDFYIDDLEIKSVMPGKGTFAAHNVTELKFNIYEPLGITLLDRIFLAAQQNVNQGGGTPITSAGNYAAQQYLMVIRWYGYDKNGNQVSRPVSEGDAAGRTDANAIVEKWIPFLFRNITFNISNSVTQYSCDAVAVNSLIGISQPRAVIPYNIQLTSTTMQKLLCGPIAYSTSQDPQRAGDESRPSTSAGTSAAKANAAPDPTLVSGLEQALNFYEARQVTEGYFNIANKYRFVISHPEIANAGVVPPETRDLRSRPNINPTSAAQAADGEKQSVNNAAKTFSAVAGTSIIQFLDLVVSSSDYIFTQQTKIRTTDKDGKPVDIVQGSPAQAFSWYRIGVQAIPIGYDVKRGDFAYETTYEIAPYGINNLKSEYFPQGKFRGSHKEYNWWFTGQNNAVIDFSQSFNYLYYITVNARQDTRLLPSSNPVEIEKRLFTPSSSQPNQGGGPALEPKANAAEYLYSPSDQAQVKLSIIGDPAWIAQGELWAGVRANRKANTSEGNYDPYFSPFLPDGTINFDAREATFLIRWRKPADYDLRIGTPNMEGNV